MPIATTCPSCQALFRLPDELAGRTVKCQKCATLFVAPNAGYETTMPGERVPLDEEPAPERTRASAGLPPIALPPMPTDEPDARPRSDDAVADDRSGDGTRKTLPVTTKSDDERSSRPRPVEKPKASTSSLGIVLGILGFVVLSFIVCGGATGIWYAVATDKQRKAAPFAKKDGFKGGRRKDAVKFDEFKNPPVNAFNGIIENRPPFDGFKDDKRPEPPPEGPPGSIRVVFDKDGTFRHDNVLAIDDPAINDPVNKDRRRHKLYIIRMEEGYKYQIDMTSPNHDHLDPHVYLRDDKREYKADNDDILQGQQRDARIIYECRESGVYHIDATYWQPRPDEVARKPGMLLDPVGPFTLIVRHVK